MGYWGVNVSALTGTGTPVPSFQTNFTAAMKLVVPSGIFVGDLVVRPSDFLLLGTEQDTDVATVPDPTAQGRVVAFQPNGELEQSFGNSGEVRFPSPMAQSVWALPRENGDIVLATLQPFVQSNPQAHAYLSLFGFSGCRHHRSSFRSGWHCPDSTSIPKSSYAGIVRAHHGRQQWPGERHRDERSKRPSAPPHTDFAGRMTGAGECGPQISESTEDLPDLRGRDRAEVSDRSFI